MKIWHRISWKEIQTFYSQHLLTLLIMGQFGVSFIYADIRTKLYTISPNGYNRNRYLTDSPMFYLKLASPSRVSYPIKGSQISSKNFFTRKNSNLYKLPLKFVSNAKPVDIIQGINKIAKIPPKKPSKLYKPSKMFYLSTKFLSNAKPIKPYLLKTFNKGKYSYKKYSTKL